MSNDELATPDNYLDIVDSMSAYEAMKLSANLATALERNTSAKFDISHLIEKIGRWEELWVPALNNELDWDGVRGSRTEWQWRCLNHNYGTDVPLSVAEISCNEYCQVQHWDTENHKFTDYKFVDGKPVEIVD